MRGLFQIFCDFANWSTVCGVPHIANAQSKLARLFWSFVFLFLIIVFVFQLYSMIVKFVAFPSMVNTDIYFEEQQFPVVTVCNFNAYKYSIVKNTTFGQFNDMRDLMNTYKLAVSQTLSADDPYSLKAVQNDSYRRDTRARDALVLQGAQLTLDQKQPALYSYNNLISECSFGGVSCGESDFTPFIDPVYGACYSFNEKPSLNYSVQRAGMKFGLKLLMTVSQNTADGDADFLPTTQLAGARIGIHARGSHPSLESQGINIGVGYQTAVSLTMTKTERCKRPYGKCSDHEPDKTNFYKDYTYTLDTCFNGCRQREAFSKCGCYNPRYAAPSDTSWCQMSKLLCLQDLKGDQANTNQPNLNPLKDCGCDPPCQEINYFTTASLARFPSAAYYVATDSVTGAAPSCDNDTQPFQGKNTDCRNWYSTNSLLLQVFFETLKYEKYTEVPSYGISDIINDLGGQAGLWLGLSVISIVEVCGLIGLLICYCITCGNIKIRPSELDMEEDDRMKDIKHLDDEIDTREKNENAMKEEWKSDSPSKDEKLN